MKFPWYVYSSEVSSCFGFKNRPHTVSSCCYNWNNSMINNHLVRSMIIRSSICNHKKWFMSFRFHALNGSSVLHQQDPKIIYPHYDFKHLTEKYFEIGMKLNDFSIQLVKYCSFLKYGVVIFTCIYCVPINW